MGSVVAVEQNEKDTTSNARPENPNTGIIDRMLNIPHFGTLMGVIGGIAYGSGNFIQKLITFEVDPMQSNACTFGVGLIFVSLWCAVTKYIPRPGPGDYSMTFTASASQAALLVFLVNSLSYIPAFNETVLVDTAPALTAIIAWVWLKEKINIVDGIIIIFAFIGVVLVSQPSFLFHHKSADSISVQNQLIGSLLALLGALSLSMYACALRKIQNTTVTALTFYSFLLILASSLILGFSMGVMKNNFSFSLVWKYVVAAVCYILNFNLVTKALKMEKAVYVIVAQACDLPTVLILQMCFLQDYPNTLAYVGASFVFFSIATIGLNDMITQRCCRASQPSSPAGEEDQHEHRICVDENKELIKETNACKYDS